MLALEVVTPVAATGLFAWAWLMIAIPAASAAVLLLIGRAGNAWGHLLGTLAPFASFVLGLLLFVQLLSREEAGRSVGVPLYEWFGSGRWSIGVGLLVDQLSIVFVLLITGVGGLIHVYSIGYMAHDERRRRFFGYLNLFVAAMLVLVLSANFLGLFLGWEGVGLASYLLIGFWQHKHSAAAASKKAFVINRVGDIGLSLAIALMFATFGTTDFAGSDSALDDEELAAAQERCAGGEIFELPNYVSPIAVLYNLEGVDELNLSPATIAGIFTGEITTWNDPAIAEDNPDAELPETAITPVHRADDSGTTENFLDYLFQAAPDVWTAEPDGVWPLEGGEAANQTSGMVDVVGNVDGAIGYADASRAGELGVANVAVGEEYVAPSPEAASAIVENSEAVEGRGEYDFAIELNRATEGSGEYPIVLVSYHIGCIQYDDEETAANVRAFMEYVISEEGQDAAAENAGSAPISDSLREQAQGAVEAISAG